MRFKLLLGGLIAVALVFAAAYRYYYSDTFPARAHRERRAEGKAVILYAGDMMGSLDPCSCSEPALGGVARRATALREQRSRFSGAPVLVLDTGNDFIQADILDHPVNPFIVEALELAGTHAVNLSLGDLRRLERMAEAGRLPREMKTRFLSSIAEKESAAAAPVEPYAIHTLADGTADPPVRIGVLAVSPLGGGPVEHYGTLEPAVALRRYLPQVEREADIVVLLTRTTDAEIAKLAAAFPAVDVIINGSPTGHGRELARAGNTVIVESAYNAIAIGILELQWDARGRITSYQNQFMPLVPLIADSAPMLALVQRSRQAYSAYKEEEARKVPPPSAPSIFAGSGACAECHEEAYRAWEKSGHARAVGVLRDSMNLYNDKCLGCHVTAFQADRGFVNMLHTPELANVHCEACHGASTDHMKNPKEIHPGIGAMQQIRRSVPREFCLRCHTPEDSPKFDYDTYWPKIRH